MGLESMKQKFIKGRMSKNQSGRTHCDSRPPCEMVIRILSANHTEETSVCVPLTRPAACLVGAGNPAGFTPLSIVRSWSVEG